MQNVREGQSWSRLRGNCILISTDAHLLSRYCSSFGEPEVRYTKRAALFSLCRRFDAHSVTAGRCTLRKFPPTFERPQAKLLPFEKRSLARVPSWQFPPSRNARPHSHRNLEPMTRSVLPETSHSGRRNLDAAPFLFLPYKHDRWTTIPLIKALLCSVWLKGPFGFTSGRSMRAGCKQRGAGSLGLDCTAAVGGTSLSDAYA